MARDLVAFIAHTSKQVWPGLAFVVDDALTEVDAGDEEGGRDVVLREEIEEFGGVGEGPVVVCQG